jgi:E3 ubiquitin-protein ligase RNF5
MPVISGEARANMKGVHLSCGCIYMIYGGCLYGEILIAITEFLNFGGCICTHQLLSSFAPGSCDCNSSFECNICLDPAKEPVVTPCGHLFCWPCLYQWLHAHSLHSECPVCKGEVLEVNVTPIYGRGGEEGDSTNPDLPPRPRANRRESLSQQLQMADTRGIATVVRQLIQNQGIVRGLPSSTGIEMTVVTTGRQRARARRPQRQDNNASPSIHVAAQNMGNVASESSNQIQLPHSNGDNAAQMVLASPQQSSSVEQLSTSSTTALIVGEPRSTRRLRPLESPTIRRTRRRPL